MINPTTYMNLRTKVIFLGLASDQKFQLQKRVIVGVWWTALKIWTNPMAPILDIDQAARAYLGNWQSTFCSNFSQLPFCFYSRMEEMVITSLSLNASPVTVAAAILVWMAVVAHSHKQYPLKSIYWRIVRVYNTGTTVYRSWKLVGTQHKMLNSFAKGQDFVSLPVASRQKTHFFSRSRNSRWTW